LVESASDGATTMVAMMYTLAALTSMYTLDGSTPAIWAK